MAPGGPPGSGSRGRGGKFKKFSREGAYYHLTSFLVNIACTGGRHFSHDLKPLDQDGNEIQPDLEDESSEEEEASSEESSEEEGDEAKPTMTREERRAAAKAKKEAAIARKTNITAQPGDLPSSSGDEGSEDNMPANPNHSKAARNQAKYVPQETTEAVKNLTISSKAAGEKAELSRREREAIQAQQAKQRYQKLHEAGKTDEAKADLARLKVIREKREAEAARKQVCLTLIELRR
jgi:Casein kinase substrate phosphoprotein PP28